MRRLLIFITALIMPLMAYSQAQINTKKVKIGDFRQKVTKVVLTGNAFIDETIKEEVAGRWRESPYEFCTLEDFEALKGNDSYYFLMNTKGQFKKESEPGLQFFTLVKGGPEAAKGIDYMLEVVSIPYASAEDPSGREMVFIPAILDIIQNYAVDCMEKDLDLLGGLSYYGNNLSKNKGMDIVFFEGDICSSVTQADKDLNFTPSVMVMDEDDADKHMTEGTPNTLVSYVVYPSDGAAGSYCYKMLIDAQTHKLYYYRKHKLSKKLGPGFLLEDIKRIS